MDKCQRKQRLQWLELNSFKHRLGVFLRGFISSLFPLFIFSLLLFKEQEHKEVESVLTVSIRVTIPNFTWKFERNGEKQPQIQLNQRKWWWKNCHCDIFYNAIFVWGKVV